MKISHFFLCMLFMGIMQTLYAQPDNNDQLQGAVVDRKESRDDAGTVTTLEEYRTTDKTLTGFKKTIRDMQGNTTTIDSMTTASGRAKRVKETRTNHKGDTTYAKETNYDKKGRPAEYQIREYNQNKVLVRVTTWKAGEEPKVNNAPEYEPRRLDPLSSVYKWEGRYDPTLGLSGGYSYLNAGTSGDNISFPLGAHITAKYNITDQIAVMADVSYHTKKDMDFRISRMFLMGGVQYDFPQKDESDITVSPHVLAGLVSDRQKYLPGDMDAYKESAFAFGAGLDANYKLSNRWSINVRPDYIFTRFNEDTQGNLRITGGVRYLFNF